MIPLDTFHLLQEIVGNPAPTVFPTSRHRVPAEITANSLTCNPGTYVTPDAPNTYAFADGVHPSGAAHRILGEYAVSVIEAPSQVALLPYSESVIGKARAEIVASHLPTSRPKTACAGGQPARRSQRFDGDVDYTGGGPRARSASTG